MSLVSALRELARALESYTWPARTAAIAMQETCGIVLTIQSKKAHSSQYARVAHGSAPLFTPTVQKRSNASKIPHPPAVQDKTS